MSENSLWYRFWHDATKASARSRAAQLCLDAGFPNSLGLNSDQTELMLSYLSASIVTKEGHKDSYLAKRPEVQATRKIPLLGLIINALVFIPDQVNDVVAEEFKSDAEKIISDIARKTRENLAVNAASKFGICLDAQELQSVLEDLPNDDPRIVGAVEQVLKPQALRRAANLISSIYLNTKNDLPDIRNNALRNTVQGISRRREF